MQRKSFLGACALAILGCSAAACSSNDSTAEQSPGFDASDPELDSSSGEDAKPGDAAGGDAGGSDGHDDAALDGTGGTGADAHDASEDAWADGPPHDGASDGASADSSVDASADAADADDAGPPTDESICYHGDFDVDGVQQVACAVWPGPVRTTVDLQGLTGGYEITAIARSADGSRIAVAGRTAASAAPSLVVYSLSGGGQASVLATAPAADRTILRPSFSADGTTVAFLADFDLAGATSLYIAATSGGAPRRLSPAPSHPALDVADFAWSRGAGSRTWLAYSGDLVQDGVFALWTVDASKLPPVAVEVIATADLGQDRDVQTGLQWDLAGRVYFRTNLTNYHVWRVHSADTSGVDCHAVEGTELDDSSGPASISAFGVSGAGDQLAFTAQVGAPNVLDVFVIPLGSPAPVPVQVSSIQPTAPSTSLVGPALNTPLRWSAGAQHLACTSDWPLAAGDNPAVVSAWQLSPTGQTSPRRILGAPQSVDQNVREVAFSRTGQRLFVRGDLLSDGAFELFSTSDLTAPDQAPDALRIEEVPPGGDVMGLELIP